jgi:hypothetical protein
VLKGGTSPSAARRARPECEETATAVPVGVLGSTVPHPSGGRLCSSATARSGAERRRWKDGGDGGGSGPARGRRDCNCVRVQQQSGWGAWSNGDTPLLGAGSARRQRSGVALWQRQKDGEGGRAAAPAQPGGPAPEARRRRRQSGCGVARRHTPSWDRPCSSTTARSGAERLCLYDSTETAGAAAPAQPARQSGYVVERRHSFRGRQCSSTTTRSGAERQRQENGQRGGAAVPAQPGGPGPKTKRRRTVRVLGHTAPHPFLGAGCARRRPPAAERSGGGGPGRTAETAGAAAPAQPARGRRDCNCRRGTWWNGDTPRLLAR